MTYKTYTLKEWRGYNRRIPTGGWGDRSIFCQCLCMKHPEKYICFFDQCKHCEGLGVQPIPFSEVLNK